MERITNELAGENLEVGKIIVHNITPKPSSISTNFLKKENNMKILDLYIERKKDKLYKEYQEKMEELDNSDKIQKFIKETVNQLNVLLNRSEDDKIEIQIHNLHGDHLREENTQKKAEELSSKYNKQREEQSLLIQEVKAILELTSDYDKQIEILKKYDILNKEGKLNV